MPNHNQVLYPTNTSTRRLFHQSMCMFKDKIDIILNKWTLKMLGLYPDTLILSHTFNSLFSKLSKLTLPRELQHVFDKIVKPQQQQKIKSNIAGNLTFAT